MRLRLILLIACFALALAASAGASAFPWPIKPFNKQHPIRANFGDPRTRFLNTMLTDGLQGPGTFLFHNGIDIAAADGTPVYPVVSGKVHYIDDSAISVRTKGHGVFQYFHIIATVRNGEQVIAGRTILGYVMRAYDHVHLSWIRGGRVWNPLARGGIAPYRDRTVPQVRAINVRPVGVLAVVRRDRVWHGLDRGGGRRHGADGGPRSLCELSARPRVPDLVTREGRREHLCARCPRSRLPHHVAGRAHLLERLRARQLSERATLLEPQFFMAGRFLYNLANGVDTRSYPNGLYEVTVQATDMRGNSSEAALRFKIENHAGTETGCAQAPSSEP